MARARLPARSFAALGTPSADPAALSSGRARSCLRLLAVLIVLLSLAVDLSVDLWFAPFDAAADDPPALVTDAAGLDPSPSTLAMAAAGNRERLRSSAALNPAHPLRAPPNRLVPRVPSVGPGI